MSLKVKLLALMLLLTVAISGVVCAQDSTISSVSKGIPSIQNWASTSGTTDVIRAAPNPSGYISAPTGNYITESDMNTAKNIGIVGRVLGTVADIATSVSTDESCKTGATLGMSLAATGTAVSIGTASIPSGVAGFGIGAAFCAPAVFSAIFDPSPGYEDLGDKAEDLYKSTHTKTYPEPYKADPEKARQEWATASWIGANGGPGQACLSDVSDTSFSSSGSSSSEDDGSVANNVDIEVSGRDPNFPGWSEVTPPCI